MGVTYEKACQGKKLLASAWIPVKRDGVKSALDSSSNKVANMFEPPSHLSSASSRFVLPITLLTAE